jgi:hypothetical protein
VREGRAKHWKKKEREKSAEEVEIAAKSAEEVEIAANSAEEVDIAEKSAEEVEIAANSRKNLGKGSCSTCADARQVHGDGNAGNEAPEESMLSTYPARGIRASRTSQHRDEDVVGTSSRLDSITSVAASAR